MDPLLENSDTAPADWASVIRLPIHSPLCRVTLTASGHIINGLPSWLPSRPVHQNTGGGGHQKSEKWDRLPKFKKGTGTESAAVPEPKDRLDPGHRQEE